MCAIIEKIQKEVPIMSTNENKGKKAEVTALQAISAEDRKDWISLAFVQAGICVCVPAFLLGALLAEAMPIWPAIISGSLGYLIVVVGMVATGISHPVIASIALLKASPHTPFWIPNQPIMLTAKIVLTINLAPLFPKPA